MIDSSTLITSLNNDCKNLFSSSFKLVPRPGHHNIKVFRVEGNSNAVNRFDLPYQSVSVLKWFKDFWIFVELRFVTVSVKKERSTIDVTHTTISLSVFQGEDSDPMKYQLFRAEWDDFENAEEKHAQPHWHITSDQAIEKTFEEYSKTFSNNDFISLLEEEKIKIFDVKKIHFALNGNWQSDDTHVHKIHNNTYVIKWFLGLLKHIRTELE